MAASAGSSGARPLTCAGRHRSSLARSFVPATRQRTRGLQDATSRARSTPSGVSTMHQMAGPPAPPASAPSMFTCSLGSADTRALLRTKYSELAEALPALAKAGLTDPTAFHALSADGAGESTSRLARLVLYPAAASLADEGKQPLSPTSEADVHRALAAVAEARLAAMPLPEQVAAAALAPDVPRELMTAFIAEKRRVLEASSSTLRRKAMGVGA